MDDARGASRHSSDGRQTEFCCPIRAARSVLKLIPQLRRLPEREVTRCEQLPSCQCLISTSLHSGEARGLVPTRVRSLAEASGSTDRFLQYRRLRRQWSPPQHFVRAATGVAPLWCRETVPGPPPLWDDIRGPGARGVASEPVSAPLFTCRSALTSAKGMRKFAHAGGVHLPSFIPSAKSVRVAWSMVFPPGRAGAGGQASSTVALA